MLHLLVESGHFLAERAKVKQLNSRLLMSAVDVIEAAYWLVGGNQFAQALVMFDNAIEIVLKGELERINPILIADTKTLDPATLKSLLKGASGEYPSGKGIQIPDFDLERTILFATAFDRVAEIYPTIRERWRRLLLSSKGAKDNALHALRNDIVHYGGDEAQCGQYVAAIVEVALPFLEEILALVTQHEESPVSLRHLLKEWIYREVDVARSVLKDLRENDSPPASYALAPLAHHVLWSHTRWPSPQDDLDSVTSSDEWFDFANRQKYPEGWNRDLIIEVSCPICNSMSADQSYVPAKVLLENDPLDQKLLVPEGFLCHVCGFLIEPRERYLAKHFVPQVPEETAAAFLKDLGVT
jgi:hypothetical protein